MSTVIVQGAFVVDPDERDRFLEGSIAGMHSSRQEEGCLEYVMAPDPTDPGRVILSERWESLEHLRKHVTSARSKRSEAGSDAGARPVPISQEMSIFEAAQIQPFG
jgi:quinol monooxygenase YgiN